MALKVAIQMDPIGPININADSTFRIAEEAQARGHSLFYYTPDKLTYREGGVYARGWPLTLRTVPVLARVISDVMVSALGACGDVPAEYLGPAGLNRWERFSATSTL